MLGRSLTRAAVTTGIVGSVLLAVATPSIAGAGRDNAPHYGPYSPAVYGPIAGADAVSLLSPHETGDTGRKVQ